MIHREALTKIPGGKTVKVELKIREGIIERAIISGDFFAYPSSIIEDIESELEGKRAEFEAIKKVLEKFREKGKLVGIPFNDLERLFEQVITK
ncbi:MAG: hypothetical protein DRN92_07075 [Thermoproteota archaeon]|nr:MAG: hypothetical protein DRN92_07075 [Candidatus Korarchaeota archaeon]